MIDRSVSASYFYKIKFLKMKKLIVIISLTLGMCNLTQAQLLGKLKTKTKAATESSVDRSTDKVVDKTVNQPADKATDKVLNKTGEKLNNLFKKKKKKSADPVPPIVPASDSTATRSESQN